jgi:hypothetical protein
MGGLLNTAVSGNIGTSGPLNSFMVNGASGDWAAISFISAGVFGGNFGMHPNGDFYCGGWSFGTGVAYKFWTERNLNPILDGQLVMAGAVSTIPTDQYYGITGAVVTALFRFSNTTMGVSGGVWRYLQLKTPGGWYTVSFVG